MNSATLFEPLAIVVTVVLVPDVELVVVTTDVWLALLAADGRAGLGGVGTSDSDSDGPVAGGSCSSGSVWCDQ